MATNNKSYPIDLHLNGSIVLSSPDGAGQVTIPADIEGEDVRIRIDGSYLVSALRACGGMVDFRLSDGSSPVVFTSEGYQVVVMPIINSQNQPKPVKAEAEPVTEPATEAETVAYETEKAQAVAEAEAITKADKPKRKRSKAREPVAVA